MGPIPASSSFVEAEAARIVAAVKKIDLSLNDLEAVRRLLAQHFKGPAADRIQANLRWRIRALHIDRDEIAKLPEKLRRASLAR